MRTVKSDPPNSSRDSFYQRQFAPVEQRDLADGRRPGVQDEIELMRVAMRRTLELASGLEDLDEMRLVLNSLATAAGRLADLIRAQEKASGSRESALEALLQRAIAEIWAETHPEPEQEREA